MSDKETKLTSKDFDTGQMVRWCPGCGDYSILNVVRKVLESSGRAKEDIAFISGIGCSSRFPYYVDTYGMHGIHGRAPAIASGLTIHNPDLSVWVITGDGDGLAIGGNHFIHAIRRNMNFNLLIFNNEIYGLTKGQYSPTSKWGTNTKTSPMGTVERPFSPAELAIGSGATFFARTTSSDPRHLKEVLLRADEHQGTSVVEILQNCLIFNDKAFEGFVGKDHREENTVKLEHGKPMVFGKENDKYLSTYLGELSIRDRTEESEHGPLVHNEQNINVAFMLSKLEYVMPLGVFHCRYEPHYSKLLSKQEEEARSQQKNMTMEDLLYDGETWKL